MQRPAAAFSSRPLSMRQMKGTEPTNKTS